MFDIVETHFWLVFGIVVGALGALQFNQSLEKHVRSGALSAMERSQFVKGWFIAIMIPSIMFWLVALWAGTGLASFHNMTWANPRKWLVLVIGFSPYVVLLWWTWAGSGAKYLSRLLTLKASRIELWIYSETGVRALSVILFGCSIAGAVIAESRL